MLPPGTGSPRLRLFFALVPDAPVRAAMAAIQERWALSARPVRPELLHVTLAFLGAVDADRVDALARLAAGLEPPAVRLLLDRTGWFPGSKVAWLGAGAPPEALLAFQHSLSAALAAAGWRSEFQLWQPHVTLYRDLRTAPAKLALEPVDWAVRGFTLLASETVPGGVQYRVLASW